MTETAEIAFALNRTVAPNLPLGAFLKLASAVGASAVEVRNDLPGVEFLDGTRAEDLAGHIADAGLKIASVNALQRFNDWTSEREAEAQALVEYARTLGAPGIVLCPVVDAHHGWSEAELERKLRTSLTALKPLLLEHGVTGFVEPLGMPASTLRFQTPAVEAISEIDGWDAFALCYDTFQFFRSNDTALHPLKIQLVHISGISRRDLAPSALTEPDRGFVDEHDICGTVDQLRRVRQAGFRGFVSMEPFDPVIQAAISVDRELRASFEFVRRALTQE